MVDKSIINKIVNNTDWDLWRKSYDKLTFEDQIEIHDKILPKHRAQKGHDTNFFIESFLGIQRYKFDISKLTVAELGAYTGILAYECMSRLNIGKWLGFEISRWAVNNTLEKTKRLGFKNNNLNDQFWKIEDLKFDIFVSSHTIEHLKDHQVIELINFVSKKALFLILQINTKNKSDSWTGYGGTHILELDINEIIKLIEQKGFILVNNMPRIGRISGHRLFFRKKIDSYKKADILEKTILL